MHGPVLQCLDKTVGQFDLRFINRLSPFNGIVGLTTYQAAALT